MCNLGLITITSVGCQTGNIIKFETNNNYYYAKVALIILQNIHFVMYLILLILVSILTIYGICTFLNF